MFRSKIPVLLGLLVSASACTLYKPPAGAPALALQGTMELPANSLAIPHVRWWEQFEDEILNTLVEEALSHNNELRIALANVNEARAMRGLERWNYWPTGGVQVSEERARVGVEAAQQQARAGISATWELDLFARARNGNLAAEARLQGTEALLDAARLLVVTETASNYFWLRAAEQKAEVRARALEQQRHVVSLTQVLVEGLNAPADQLDRARAELATDELALSRIEEECRLLENRLAVMIGRQPGSWQVPAASHRSGLRFHPSGLGDIAVLLRSRPDVRHAEQMLVARQAEAGTERAGYFPSVWLSGFVGFAAGSIGALGGASSEAWAMVPSLSWDLLDFGRNSRRVAASNARVEAAEAAYHQVILTAIEDTRNALERYERAHRELLLSDSARSHAVAATAAAEARFQEGYGSYLDALLARRDAIGADLARIDAIAIQRRATIELFTAVGAVPRIAGQAIAGPATAGGE